MSEHDEKLIAVLRGNLQRAREELAAELNRQHEEEVSAFRAERDAALAVIAQVRGRVKTPIVAELDEDGDPLLSESYVEGANGQRSDIRRILATSPPDALDAVKAAAWDEGYTVGNAHNGRRDANPYRKENPNE